MTGKKIVFIVIIFTIIALILTWFYLEYIIVEYDLDRAMNTTNTFMSSIKGTLTSLGTTNRL